jgi:hypothetical protein
MGCFELAEPAQNTPHPGFFEKILYFGLKVRAKWD